MNDGAFLGIIAGVIGITAYIPYVLSILNGKTRPNRASWWIWAVLSIIICASYWSVGARNTFWFTLPVGIIITAFLSIKYGVGGWTPFDRVCLLGAAACLLVWWISGMPFIALIMAMLIDIIGYLPTMRKAWNDPASENMLTWAMFSFGAAINIFALEMWTLELAIYPVYIALFNGAVFGILILKRVRK